MIELDRVVKQKDLTEKVSLTQTMKDFLRKVKPQVDVGTYIDGDNYCIRFYDSWRKEKVVEWIGITEEQFYQFKKMFQELGDEQ